MKQTMLARVTAYLALRRSLGYKLRIEGQMLQNFARYADRSGHNGPLTRSLALHWATLPHGADRPNPTINPLAGQKFRRAVEFFPAELWTPTCVRRSVIA